MLLRVCANQSLATCRRHGKILFQKSRFSTTRHNNSTPGFKHRNFSTTSSTKKPFYEAYFVGVGVTLVAGYAWNIIVPSSFPIRTQCELQAMAPVPEKQTISVKVVDEKTLWQKGKRALLIVRRMIKLMIVLSPLAALYPLQFLLHSPHSEDEDAQDIVLAALKQKNLPDGIIGWYYKLCLFCVEWSGAAAIKIMQWAGSRPDMFGPVFCAVFSQLQDDTTPHAWNHTEKALQESFGENWQEHIRLGGILGSGCIAQVYKGVVFVKDGTEQEVAVKVMHPHVDDDIDADLDIMRLSVRFLEKLPFDVFRNIKWLNLDGFIDEMDKMLNIQLDLRTEADHLVRFNENFKNNENVIFPKLVDGYEPTKTVLMETFCEGIPVLEFVRQNSATNREILSQMCHGAIEAVCQMIFLDNFCHGDLHPGNVLVSPDHKFVLLDVGIVMEHSHEDHILISDVLAAFIRCEGRKAGRIMIDDSNSRLRGSGDRALEEERYIDKIEMLTIEAKGKAYLMHKLGTYITYICNAAAQHHVMLNQTFISAALCVKVQEGIALAMDPSIEIWRVAIPIILEGERRNFSASRAKELLGVESIFEWVFGGDNKSKNGGDRLKNT